MSTPGPADAWPRHFPEDCPPAEAGDAAGDIFRLVRSDPPGRADMESWLEQGIDNPKARNTPPCQRAALSVFVTLEDAAEGREAMPRWRSSKIARATFVEGEGRLMQTGRPGHHSLWLRAAVLGVAHERFVVIS